MLPVHGYDEPQEFVCNNIGYLNPGLFMVGDDLSSVKPFSSETAFSFIRESKLVEHNDLEVMDLSIGVDEVFSHSAFTVHLHILLLFSWSGIEHMVFLITVCFLVKFQVLEVLKASMMTSSALTTSLWPLLN